MKCKEAKKYLQAMMDLGAIDNKEIISHIESCADCAKEYDAIKALKGVLSFKEETIIPVDFNARVWQKIGRPAPSMFEKIFGFKPGFSFVFKTAAGFAAIIFMVVMARNSFVKNEIVAQVSPQAQVKTVVAKVFRHEHKPAGAAGETKNPAQTPAEVALISAPEIKAPENKGGAVVQGNPEQSPGKGPVVAENKISINLDKKQNPAAVNSAQEAPGMSAASYSKVPPAKEETMKEPIEIRNNVFNPAQGGKISIKYEVKTAGPVTLQAYNKKGELVKTIFTGIRQPGIYEDSWDGACDNGTIAAAGVYIVYVKTDIVEKRIKAALIK